MFDKLCVSKLCAPAGGSGAGGRAEVHNQKHNHPTQRCGEKQGINKPPKSAKTIHHHKLVDGLESEHFFFPNQ